jgi:hypothetical protein
MSRIFHLAGPSEVVALLCGDTESSGKKLNVTAVGVHFTTELVMPLMPLQHMPLEYMPLQRVLAYHIYLEYMSW